jgi:predicted glycosyltransferase
MVISAGGTMNREAAVLGTPAYTIYAGKMGSVDRYLIRKGKISLIQATEDIARIKPVKKTQNAISVSRKVFDYIIDIIENYHCY